MGEDEALSLSTFHCHMGPLYRRTDGQDYVIGAYTKEKRRGLKFPATYARFQRVQLIHIPFVVANCYQLSYP
jgi:hypothetical protein